jgi:hypothetical protein
VIVQGTVIRTGDVIKFGRVPFRVKENSVQAKEGVEFESQPFNEGTMEKNMTEVDSADLDRELDIGRMEGDEYLLRPNPSPVRNQP